jgi:uncharacterized protein YajQ (UPF0234 family)
MPSFDIVSEVDVQEVTNAVDQASREIGQRFDFRGGKSSIAFDKEKKTIKILADDELKLRAIHTIMDQKFAKRGIDLQSLKYGAEEAASGGLIRQSVSLRAGMEKAEAKKITAAIKDLKLKVQAQIQGEQVRVEGKKIDDLQEVQTALQAQQFGFALQFVNQRS